MGSLVLSHDICSGTSGEALRTALQAYARDDIRLLEVRMLCMYETMEQQFQIAYRRKDGHEGVLKFTLPHGKQELPAEVILAKLALI